MSVLRLVAWRFMLKGTEKGRFSPMTLFAWLAIGVGVGAMSSLLSVMYGFESTLRERVLKAYPHVLVVAKGARKPIADHEAWSEKFKTLDKVKKSFPYLESEMIFQSSHRTLGGVVWGMHEADLETLRDILKAGKIPKLDSPKPEVLLGTELALRLGLTPGDVLKVISPTETRGAFGSMPKIQNFVVSGLVQSGHYDFDQQYAYFLMEDAQDLMKVGKVISGWHIWGADIDDTDEVLTEVEGVLPPQLEAQSWKVFNSALFQSLKLEQYAMFIVLSFAILIAVMNIGITLIMHVTHKRKNIGILRALGASYVDIKKIFMWQGLFLGGVGLVIGALLTVAFMISVKYLAPYQLPEIYYDRTIPIEIRPVSLALTYIVAIVLIYLSTLYPSRRAAMLDPVQAIKE